MPICKWLDTNLEDLIFCTYFWRLMKNNDYSLSAYDLPGATRKKKKGWNKRCYLYCKYNNALIPKADLPHKILFLLFIWGWEVGLFWFGFFLLKWTASGTYRGCISYFLFSERHWVCWDQRQNSTVSFRDLRIGTPFPDVARRRITRNSHRDLYL